MGVGRAGKIGKRDKKVQTFSYKINVTVMKGSTWGNKVNNTVILCMVTGK